MNAWEGLGTTGGGALLLLLGQLGKGWLAARYRRAESVRPPRSLSPSGGIRAVRDELLAREEGKEAARVETLLQGILSALERLEERLGEVAEAFRQDLKETRHGLKTEIQSIRFDLPAVCRAPEAPRPRMPSRPGG